jgi:flagellar biosynthesis/type III secretory pathway protein FliH
MQQGIQQGVQQGMRQGIQKGVEALLQNGVTDKYVIANAFKMDVQEIDSIIAELGKHL